MSLQTFRHSMRITQTELAEKMGVTQGEISKIEGRGDVLVSTLRRYVEAMGYDLQISVVDRESK